MKWSEIIEFIKTWREFYSRNNNISAFITKIFSRIRTLTTLYNMYHSINEIQMVRKNTVLNLLVIWKLRKTYLLAKICQYYNVAVISHSFRQEYLPQYISLFFWQQSSSGRDSGLLPTHVCLFTMKQKRFRHNRTRLFTS